MPALQGDKASDLDFLAPGTKIGGSDNYARRRMDIAAFCTESKVLVVAGKGGVGKSTVAALAVDGRPGRAAGPPASSWRARPAAAASAARAARYEDVALVEAAGGSVRGRWITPDDALVE